MAVRAFLDFLFQAIVKVVMHLRDEVVVGEIGKDDVVVGHGDALKKHAAQSGGSQS
jgi:hypothetical protein